jgi:uncharacterized protein YuzE
MVIVSAAAAHDLRRRCLDALEAESGGLGLTREQAVDVILGVAAPTLAAADTPATFAYDPTAGTAYVALAPMPAGGVAQTVEMPAMLEVDLDEDGRLLGMQIIGTLTGIVTTPKETS